MRSKKNSIDQSNDFDVLNEFLKKIYKIEKNLPKYIILLRPTTPLRNSKIIDKAITKFKKIQRYDSLISVHMMNEPVHKKFFVKKNVLKPVISNITIDQANNPRQNFPSSFTANGYLDIIKTENILEKKKYLGDKCFPFIVPRTIDIDDKLDLNIANYLLGKKYI
jgi:CMP-N-acetylneuraminic acid synthetase